ncbi:variable large family protein [Borreliella lusitaniae]|uniref:Variable large family protein n=1 Tax=Borreliella lusitaniae TaxID=100177 RepID=A0ACD5GLW6_9SPIR
MVAAAREAGAAATGAAADEIAAVDAQNAQAGAVAEENSVKGIAKGMKGIVDAAEALGVELKVVAAAAAAGAANANAGHLFAGAGNGANANAARVEKAADAVSKVSGKQIIKAIVDSKEGAGAAPGQATSPIEAAIGADAQGAAFGEDKGMDKDDKIAAAIVLRGMAKEAMKNRDGGAEIAAVDAAGQAGVVADGASVKGIAKGMKGIVETAKELGVELKVVAAAAAGGAANANAGHLFGNDGAGANAAHIEKATDAVSKVSGKQIIKAIVDSKEGAGKKPADAESPIEAAIGTDEAGAPFGQEGMNKDDKIAAAIVLRGMAKDGKFAHANDAGQAMKIGDGSCC